MKLFFATLLVSYDEDLSNIENHLCYYNFVIGTRSLT